MRPLSIVLAASMAVLAAPRAAVGRSFESDGVSINYAVQGRGEAVILVHGWLSSGWINWELPGIVRSLAADHRVVWLDMPGHGGSAKPVDEAAYGHALVDHVRRLMDHLDIKKAHPVGYSMGGIVVARFVVDHPDRVLSAALGGMGWLREGSLEQRVFEGGGRDGRPVGICFRSLAKLALTEDEVRGIRTPLIILFGDRDPIRDAYTLPLRRVRPDWRVVDIRDADHITCILKPEFRQELGRWLDR